MMNLRIAITQTISVYPNMPNSLDGLLALICKLDDIRNVNIAHHLELIEIAADAGVKAIGLGELFTAPYFALSRDETWFAFAEDAATGPTVTAMSLAATRYNMVVIAPIYELDRTTGSRYNTAVIIDADGSILGKYRKVHIPAGHNEQASFDEMYYYNRSEVPQNIPSPMILGKNPFFPVFQTVAGRVGVSICYDRHFEGVVRSLSRAGAQVIFSPAVTFGTKSSRLWQREFEVDAARHGVFIAGSNRFGAESPWNQPFFGNSHIVGPDGRLPDISSDSKLIIADCDLDSLASPDPSGWNLPRDARPSVYTE